MDRMPEPDTTVMIKTPSPEPTLQIIKYHEQSMTFEIEIENVEIEPPLPPAHELAITQYEMDEPELCELSVVESGIAKIEILTHQVEEVVEEIEEIEQIEEMEKTEEVAVPTSKPKFVLEPEIPLSRPSFEPLDRPSSFFISTNILYREGFFAPVFRHYHYDHAITVNSELITDDELEVVQKIEAIFTEDGLVPVVVTKLKLYPEPEIGTVVILSLGEQCEFEPDVELGEIEPLPPHEPAVEYVEVEEEKWDTVDILKVEVLALAEKCELVEEEMEADSVGASQTPENGLEPVEIVEQLLLRVEVANRVEILESAVIPGVEIVETPLPLPFFESTQEESATSITLPIADLNKVIQMELMKNTHKQKSVKSK
jgi:hypothetical protein